MKLGDFGWSAGFSEEFKRQSVCGTVEYNAPEVFSSVTQTKKLDIWSIGCIAYFMLHLRHPFVGNNFEQVKRMYDDIDSSLQFS